MGCKGSRPDTDSTASNNGENSPLDGPRPPSSDAEKVSDKEPSPSSTIHTSDEDNSRVNTVIKIQAVVASDNKVRSTMKHEDGEDVNGAGGDCGGGANGGGGSGGGNGAAETSSAAGEEEVAASSQSAGDPTKEEMEAEFREDDKELCDAVKKIQSTFRGKAFRKGVEAVAADNIEEAAKDEKAEPEPPELSTDVAAATPTTPSVEDELADIDMADPGLAKAASMIQGKFRMKRK